ncbi:hypothetical protein Taro_028577 [Colocasia esculenta]|uniref:Uncharacterized protein n=1 Tax=Colocasia esculenta TaxID=4460 RepID=A0A843VGT8_COLES|nr:hypothetical protein [Colocasia esculenta]
MSKSSGVIKRHTSRRMSKSSGVIKRHTSRPMSKSSGVTKDIRKGMLPRGGTNTPLSRHTVF